MQAKSDKSDKSDNKKDVKIDIKTDDFIPEGKRLFLERQKQQQEYLRNLYKK